MKKKDRRKDKPTTKETLTVTVDIGMKDKLLQHIKENCHENRYVSLSEFVNAILNEAVWKNV